MNLYFFFSVVSSCWNNVGCVYALTVLTDGTLGWKTSNQLQLCWFMLIVHMLEELNVLKKKCSLKYPFFKKQTNTHKQKKLYFSTVLYSNMHLNGLKGFQQSDVVCRMQLIH